VPGGRAQQGVHCWIVGGAFYSVIKKLVGAEVAAIRANGPVVVQMVAAKAYDNYNNDLALSGLKIHTPYTIRDVVWDGMPPGCLFPVCKQEVQEWDL
jgi:hypothetical protein